MGNFRLTKARGIACFDRILANMFTTLLICALALAETKTIQVQIALDRRGYSSNTIDGHWGRKSQSALEKYCQANNLPVPATPEAAYDRYFANEPDPFGVDTVSSEELNRIVVMPKDPADKAKLPQLGYASIKEMYAERGHVSRRALERLNPGINWTNVTAGTRIMLPDFPSMESELSLSKLATPPPPKPNEATLIRVSLTNFEITAWNSDSKLLAVFPCSIAKDKTKIPQGELKIVSMIPHPNYTYTPDFVPKGKKISKQILAEGPRNPVGVVWIGMSLPGYGIHGTPSPETIGRAESHGCFRLSNWNAARLFALARIGTRVIVDP